MVFADLGILYPTAYPLLPLPIVVQKSSVGRSPRSPAVLFFVEGGL